MSHLSQVLLDILDERKRQDAKWGEQNHKDLAWDLGRAENADCRHEAIGIPTPMMQKGWMNKCAENGELNWTDIALEEFCEAVEADDPVERRKELVQLAAVVVAWIEAMDRRPK